MNQEKKNYLASIYFNAEKAASFTSAGKLHQYTRKDGRYDISKYQIQKWLSENRVPTLHKHVKHKFKTRRVLVGHRFQQLDIDTVNMTRYVKFNRKYQYILLCIDILSRYVYTVLLKSLKDVDMVKALRRVLNEIKPRKVQRVQAGIITSINIVIAYCNNFLSTLL